MNIEKLNIMKNISILQISGKYLNYSPSYTEISDYNNTIGNVWKALIINRDKILVLICVIQNQNQKILFF